MDKKFQMFKYSLAKMFGFKVFLVLVIAYRKTDGEEINNSHTGDDKYPRPVDEKYFDSRYLDKERFYKLSWKFDNATMTFQVQVKSTGWVGLGFSPNGGMSGSDIVICWFDDNGAAHISDRYANENGFPLKDTHQDYILLGGQKSDEGLTFIFQRDIDTCDKQDNEITTSATRLIYAFDDAVPKSEDVFYKHAINHRGTKTVYLFDPPSLESQLPDDVVTLEFRANNVSVPDDFHTLYWCEIIELPDLGKPHHLIRHEPIIQGGNERVVHHIILSYCGESMRKYLGKGGEACFDRDEKNFTKPFLDCGSSYVFVWAVGGENFSYPDDVGLLMNDNNKSRIFLFEVHYDNSQYRKNIVDNSGMRLYLTPTLRKHTLNQFYVATPVSPAYQILPHGQESFTTYAYCSAECTQAIPPEGWTVVSALLHEHHTGVRGRLRHIRNGVMLQDILNDQNYDFTYQNARLVKEEIKIYPGDQLVAECIYKTVDQNATTYGGFATRAEMCFIFLEVYPLVDSFTCYSAPSPSETWKIFGANITNDDPAASVIMPDGANMSLSDFALTQIHFNSNGQVEYYQNAVRNSKHLVFCGLNDGKSKDTYPVQVSKMKFQYGYPKVDHFTRNDGHKCLLSGKP